MPDGRQLLLGLDVGTTATKALLFDLQGRGVGGMAPRILGPGPHGWTWEGGGDAGRAPAGIYFARLLVDGKTLATRRLVRLP